MSLLETAVGATKGRFVSITLTNSKGGLRVIRGRFGAHQHDSLAGTYSTFSNDQCYYRIWSARERGYRMVSANQIVNIKAEGNTLYNRKCALKDAA